MTLEDINRELHELKAAIATKKAELRQLAAKRDALLERQRAADLLSKMSESERRQLLEVAKSLEPPAPDESGS